MFVFRKNPWIIRRITSSQAQQQKQVFLTFDDGPNPELTPLILDLLKKENALASFFVIGAQARKNPDLLLRILREGHSVFSHSLDHRYDLYFKGKNSLKTWLAQSLADLEKQTQLKHRVFRPPAGVLTPPLLRAARELQVPLVLWNHRFFDTAQVWTEKKALKSARRIGSGDIVLLHDRQKPEHRDLFLATLSKYLQEVRQRGYSWSTLSDSILQKEVHRA